MPNESPSVHRIKEILGKYSIAPVRNWLKQHDLASTMGSRDAMVERVHGLIEKGELSEAELVGAAIGIEEASSKRTFLFRIPNDSTNLAKIDHQLASLNVPLTTERIPSTAPTSKPKLVYAINTPACFRAKWNEKHTRVRANKKSRTFEDAVAPKVIVLIVNKDTGIVQIRYDKPDDVHWHVEDDQPSDQAYFDYFKEQAESLTGLPLEPVDFREGLERVLKTEPWVVRTNYTVDDTEESRTKRTQKNPEKDIRDTAEWKRIAQDRMVRTFEEAPLWWIPEMSQGHLKRRLFCYVDADNGFIRFDANCNEDEIEYVLHQLVPESAAAAIA